MTQEKKDLLLKDLSARLSYGVRVCYKIHSEDEPFDVTLSGLLLDYFNNKTVVEVKAYLRPMSSMTEEEKEKYFKWKALFENGLDFFEQDLKDVMDWLNAHHFDYRGLIQMGLALEATEDMYKIVPTSI